MMISFLAYLEGGVSFGGSETRRSTEKNDPIDPVDADDFHRLSTSLATGLRDEAEYRAIRHHTASSLFNALHGYLHDDTERLVTLREPSQLENLEPGDLVEVSGQYIGNPWENVLSFFAQLIPYVENFQDGSSSPSPRSSASRPKNAKPAAGPQAVQQPDEAVLATRMILQMRKEIQESPAHDLLLKTALGLQAVLTVSSEYFSATTSESLRSGEFKAIGKVTRVITGERTINLTRRTVIGAASPALAQQLIDDLRRSSPDLNIEVAESIVKAPAVQLLPMSIFI